MARRERPWWWAARRSYYVIVNGVRHRLGADRAAAYKRWHEIAAGASAKRPPSHTSVRSDSTLTLQQLYDGYTAHQQSRVGWQRMASIKSLLGILTRVWGGGRSVATLTHADFNEVKRQRRWAPATATLARRTFTAACNWAEVENPLRGLRTGRGRSRELLLPTPEQTQTLLRAASASMRDLLEALHDTGARPSEVATVTAADLRGDRWVLPVGKNGKPRIVYLTERVRLRCAELARLRPTGPLYLSPRGSPWPLRSYVFAQAFRRLRLRCGLPAGLTLYSFRHSWATDAISRGVPEAVVCEQLGNTTAVLNRHYVHLRGRGDAVRDALRRTRGGS